MKCECERCRGEGEVPCPDCNGEGKVAAALVSMLIHRDDDFAELLIEYQKEAKRLKTEADRLSVLRPAFTMKYRRDCAMLLIALEHEATAALQREREKERVTARRR